MRSLLLIAFTVLFSHVNSWKGPMHVKFTERAVNVMPSGHWLLNNLEALMIGVQFPDIHETDCHSFCGHFFDPRTSRNLFSMKNPSARSRFLEHLARSRSREEHEEKEAALDLGKALHYLQDVHVPYHVNDMFNLAAHMHFEKLAICKLEEWEKEPLDRELAVGCCANLSNVDPKFFFHTCASTTYHRCANKKDEALLRAMHWFIRDCERHTLEFLLSYASRTTRLSGKN